MRRPAIALLTLTTLACQPAKPSADSSGTPPASQATEQAPAAERAPAPRKPLPSPEPELGPIPSLESISAPLLASGQFGLPAGTDELAPRVALELGDGLLLAGQAYHQRRSAPPPQSWRWTGFIPLVADGNDAESRLFDPGAIRAGIVSDGRALLVGTSGLGFDSRGWFATVDRAGVLEHETVLASEGSTELFDLVPGRGEGELAVVGGYVDAQGWLVSLDARAQPRWDKYIGSYGYTQIRALTRLEGGDLFALGSRGEGVPEAWSARATGDGGERAAGADVTQTKIEIQGADPNQGLRLIVDLGEAGSIAFGTASKQLRQAHEQLVAASFDRVGKLGWTRVIEGVRVVELLDARALAHGDALVLVSVPVDASATSERALALLTISSNPSIAPIVRRLDETEGWTSAGFVGGTSAAPELLVHSPSATGLQWRRLATPDLAH